MIVQVDTPRARLNAFLNINSNPGILVLQPIQGVSSYPSAFRTPLIML